jgi:hypothetical protein
MSSQLPTPIEKQRRNRRLFVLILAFVLLIVGPFLLYSRLGRRFSPEAFNAIQEGMTEEQVEAIFGCPAGDHSYLIPWLRPRVTYKKSSHPEIAKTKEWRDSRTVILISFDHEGKVQSKSMHSLPSIFEELRSRF